MEKGNESKQIDLKVEWKYILQERRIQYLIYAFILFVTRTRARWSKFNQINCPHVSLRVKIKVSENYGHLQETLCALDTMWNIDFRLHTLVPRGNAWSRETPKSPRVKWPILSHSITRNANDMYFKWHFSIDIRAIAINNAFEKLIDFRKWLSLVENVSISGGPSARLYKISWYSRDLTQVYIFFNKIEY